MNPANERPVFLLGNPNCGKTSLFNALTGQKLKVGNWPGVTLDRIQGSFTVEGQNFQVTDLPGTYSLTPYSPEERVVPLVLEEASRGLVLNVIDCGNLERNLVLTLQLLEIGIRPLLALNCHDELAAQGASLDLRQLEELTGCRAVATVARTGEGVPELITAIQDCSTAAYTSAPRPPAYLSRWLAAGLSLPIDTAPPFDACSPDQKLLFLRRLSREETVVNGKGATSTSPTNAGSRSAGTLAETMASDRFAAIATILSAALFRPTTASAVPPGDWLDRLATNRWTGLPLLLALMALIFWSTFFLGQIPSDGIEALVEHSRAWLKIRSGTSLLANLLLDGIIPGVGGVLVFLPNVLILFLWIAVLEDSGYLARAAFLLDRFMQMLGLHGRAFIPLLMGFGCNVPAIMATKIMETTRQRLALIFLIPFLGCSARLPVLTLFTGAFFQHRAGLFLFLMFLLNFLLVILIAFVVSRLVPPAGDEGFLMEMPPYRWPNRRTIWQMLKEKVRHFLEKAGTVVLCGTIVVWFLSTFPRGETLSQDFDAKIAGLEAGSKNPETVAQIERLTLQKAEEILAGKYMTRMGQAIFPLVEPLGFSWREAVALFPGFLAKESIVSTLAVLYSTVDPDLGTAMKKSGRTPLTAVVFMLFVLLYVPCLPTVGVIYQESRSWAFTLATMVIPFVLAWITAFAVFQTGILLGWQ